MNSKHRTGGIFLINLPHGHGANGLDLPEAIIIVDYVVIKNTSSMRIVLPACVYCNLNNIQEPPYAC